MGKPKDKDNEKEFILGVSQGEAIGELRIEDYRNNFVYQQYLESHNWHEYIDSKNLDESIDNKIRNSKYKPIYETVGRIKYEDAVNIYFYLKEIVKKEHLIQSNIYLFAKIMDILGVNVNLAFSYVPLDEKLSFKKELGIKNLITEKNESKHNELF